MTKLQIYAFLSTITPFYLPEEGDKYTCVFCDHPSDIIVLIWVDDYKRIGGERRGIIGSSLCNNCLEYYLDDEGHLILSDLISDAEFKSEECNKDVCLVGDPVPSRNESLYLTHDDNKVCMFCDCPADIIVFSWGDKSNDMLRSAICKNCLENYLDNNKHLILHALVLDTGYA